MIGALAGLIEEGRRQGLLRRLVGLGARGTTTRSRSRSARAATAPTRTGSSRTSCRGSTPTAAATRRSASPASRFGAYHAANLALRRADLFPLALCLSRRLRRLPRRLGRARRRRLLQQPARLRRSTCTASTSTGSARAFTSLLVVGQGAWEDSTGALDSTNAVRVAARGEGDPHELDVWGQDVAARLARMARADRAPSTPLCLTHLIGLLLGTEEDWPRRFEALVSRLPEVATPARRTRFRTERIMNEPFDLRAKPRYALVIDRLGWWYDLAREWMKKVGADGRRLPAEQPVHVPGDGEALRLLRDDPPRAEGPGDLDGPAQGADDRAAARVHGAKFEHMASRYNLPFDLDEVAEQVGYPLYMKPFDGGPVGRRHADRGRRRAARASTTPRASG